MNFNVGLLIGGVSKEREVSLNSGKNCLNSLKKLGYNVTAIDLNDKLIGKKYELTYLLKKNKIDFCFNALHGGIGENGSIQGFLNTMKIPYTHSGVKASSIAIDKLITKSILHNSPIIFPKNINLKLNRAKKIFQISKPTVIKPISEGSSIGLKIINNKENIPLSFLENTSNLMAEEFIDGVELTVTVLKGAPLCVTEIIPKSEKFYNYDSKYLEGGSQHIIPARIPKATYKTAMEWSKIAYKIIGCRGIARADFKYNPANKKLYMLELNTHPGMTSTSLVPEQAKYCGINFNELILTLSESAKCD